MRKAIACNTCGNHFIQKTNLRRHKESVHGRNKSPAILVASICLALSDMKQFGTNKRWIVDCQENKDKEVRCRNEMERRAKEDEEYFQICY